eukprot:Awhi_evm1s2363
MHQFVIKLLVSTLCFYPWVIDDPIEEIDGEEEEEEDDDDDDAEVEESASSSFRARQSAQKFGLLLDTFTDNQNARYEAFRQSSFPKAGSC